MNDAKTKLSPEEYEALRREIIGDVKSQLVNDLKSEELKQREFLAAKKEAEKKAREDYVERMKESPNPWVDILGAVETDSGVKMDIEWNDAFVDHLKKHGISGANDEQIVQKWVTLLLRDMADEMEERKSTSEYV